MKLIVLPVVRVKCVGASKASKVVFCVNSIQVQCGCASKVQLAIIAKSSSTTEREDARVDIHNTGSNLVVEVGGVDRERSRRARRQCAVVVKGGATHSQ